jgi:hypothetical protein
MAKTSSVVTRVTQVALLLNALLHGIASVGMAVGFGPHAASAFAISQRRASAVAAVPGEP